MNFALFPTYQYINCLLQLKDVPYQLNSYETYTMNVALLLFLVSVVLKLLKHGTERGTLE